MYSMAIAELWRTPKALASAVSRLLFQCCMVFHICHSSAIAIEYMSKLKVEVLSIKHKMSLPPAFLSVYVHCAITQIEFVVIGHMNVTLWTVARAFDRIARIVSI